MLSSTDPKIKIKNNPRDGSSVGVGKERERKMDIQENKGLKIMTSSSESRI